MSPMTRQPRASFLNFQLAAGEKNDDNSEELSTTAEDLLTDREAGDDEIDDFLEQQKRRRHQRLQQQHANSRGRNYGKTEQDNIEPKAVYMLVRASVLVLLSWTVFFACLFCHSALTVSRSGR